MNLPSGNSLARRSKALLLVSADAWPVVIWGLGDGMLGVEIRVTLKDKRYGDYLDRHQSGPFVASSVFWFFVDSTTIIFIR